MPRISAIAGACKVPARNFDTVGDTRHLPGGIPGKSLSCRFAAAGQDILFDDPLGGMELLPSDFGLLTWRLLRSIPDVPLALVLEGGYGPSHGPAIAEIFRILAGENAKMITGATSETTERVIGEVVGEN